MIWRIAKRDFLSNLLSARFVIGFLLCLFLIPFTLLVNLDEYSNQVRIYQIDKTRAEKSFKEVRVYSFLRPEIVQPPEPLSIFCKGISPNVGNKVNIWLGEKSLLAEGNMKVRDNPLLNSFFSIDFISIIVIIMSLLAIIFTHDVCTREKETGTLRQQLANSISRSKILLGKVSGVYITLLPIILFCYLLSFLLISFSPHIAFSAKEWVRIGILFFSSLVYFSVFIFIGLFISTQLKSSVTSMIVCLLLWVVFVFIIPNVSVYLAESLIRIESRDTLDYTAEKLNDELERSINYHKYRELEYPDWDNRSSNSEPDGGIIISNCSRSFVEWQRLSTEYAVPLRIEYADKKWTFQKVYLDDLNRQRLFAERFSLLSPSESFRLISSTICRTDVDSHRRYMERTRTYRETFIDYLRSKNLFSSTIWFTPIPEENFLTGDEIVRYVSKGEIQNVEEWDRIRKANKDQINQWYRSVPDYYHDDYPFLDVSDVPRFQFEAGSVLPNLSVVLYRLAGLLLVCIVLFYISFLSFMKYDVR